MADISITPANVMAGTGAKKQSGTFGETVTAGQVVYKSSADGEWYKADTSTSAKAAAVGIALNGGSNGQPGEILTEGPITIGGTVVVGTVYGVSDTAGGIRPISENGTADYVTILGGGTSATVIEVNINALGVAVPGE